MYENMPLFQTAAAMARHAGQRQAITARNVANADTPGYRAQELGSFKDTYRAAPEGALSTRATRAGHMAGTMTPSMARPTQGAAEPSPNGNSVSLELEMLNAVDNQREHDRAISIYKHGLSVLRAALGR